MTLSHEADLLVSKVDLHPNISEGALMLEMNLKGTAFRTVRMAAEAINENLTRTKTDKIIRYKIQKDNSIQVTLEQTPGITQEEPEPEITQGWEKEL